MPNAISVAAPILNYRLKMAERLGANRATMLAKSGIDAKIIEDPTQRISLEKELKLWKAMIEETGREDLGIICGLNFPIQATGLIGYVMMNSKTIGLAIKKICAYQKLIGDSMGMRMEETKDYTAVYIDLWTDWREELRYTLDILLTACLSWAEKNTVNPIRPIRVGVQYEQPANYQDYSDAFYPAPVEFGTPVSHLVYHKSDMNFGLISPDQGMFEFFEKQVKALYHEFEGANTIAHKTKKLILEFIEGENPGIEKIASEMTMSVRSLQKALKAEGTGYQRLLNETRKELAINYLKKGVFNKTEIAFLLGFSEVAAFSKSFKKWTGYSPSQFSSANI